MADRGTKEPRRCGVVQVELDARTIRASIRVELGSFPRVDGRILGEDGRPVRVEGLRFYSQVQFARSKWHLKLREIRAQRRTGGFAYVGIPATDEGRLWFSGSAEPDGDGRFEAGAKFFGDCLLVFWVRGYRPVRMRLGRLEGKKSLGEIRLAAPRNLPHIQFRSNGVPLANHSVSAIDHSSEIGRPVMPSSRLDGQGEVDGAWFEAGRKYYLGLSGDLLKVSGCLLYSGASIVDVSTDLTRLR